MSAGRLVDGQRSFHRMRSGEHIEVRAERVALFDHTSNVCVGRGALDLHVVSNLAIAGRAGRVEEQHAGHVRVGVDVNLHAGDLDTKGLGPKLVAHCEATAERGATVDTRSGGGSLPTHRFGHVCVEPPVAFLAHTSQAGNQRRRGLVGVLAGLRSALDDR